MGTAFVLVSNDFFRASRKRITQDIYFADQTPLIERAFYELLRGPDLTDNDSPLRGHSLLADMYGYGFAATVATSTADANEHFITLTLNNDARNIIDGAAFSPDPIPGLFNGHVISVTNGNAQGLSARIIDHQISSSGSTHTFVIMPARTVNGFSLANAPALVGSRVVVNGRPFSGTGAGHYNPFKSRSEAALSDSAVQPNQSGRSLAQLIGQGAGGGYFSRSTSFGTQPNSMGPNESYDTFDFQNMFLAGINPDGSVEHPSFHRGALASGTRGDFRAFTIGGPNGDGVVVDNNNDGQVDGIWMETGLSMQVLPNGTCVKPLVSYTVVDMGGKLNVNAHGSLLKEGSHSMTEIPLLGGVSPGSRGQGYGPPEINLSAVMTSSTGAILQGSAVSPGRYGMDGFPGEKDVRDDWSSYKLFGYPDGRFGDTIPGTVNRLFGTAMDVHGRFAVGYPQIFDVSDISFPIGLPVANVGFSTLANEIVDSPYEMTFSTGPFFGPGNRGFDAPFQLKELEAVMRRRDHDANFLPSRLLDLGSAAFLSGSSARSITTDSFEVPTTFENLPEKLYRILSRDTGVDGIPNSTANRDSVIRDNLKLLLPPEVFRGLPMNVNREFGDGVDNNENGVIDEVGETDFVRHPSGDQLEFDHDNDGQVGGDADTFLGRNNFARNLYIVTLLSTERIDRNGDGRVNTLDWYDFNDDGTTDYDDLLDYRRLIAQWVANVVDFRDRDSIMNPFEADLNPWNGWGVDGNITSNEDLLEGTPKRQLRQLFWGAERPELLITETMATHDRRTQDSSFETVLDGTDAGRISSGDDTDFDSHLVPKVSAFFELYNPWVMNDANQVRPAELYDKNLEGVDLQRTSLDGSSPVWRLVVTGHDEKDLNPDNKLDNEAENLPTSVRRIYFARPSFTVDSGREVYFPETDIEAGLVGPGRYAVVGTQGRQVGDRYDTYLGRRSTPEALDPKELDDLTRRISLNPVDNELEIVSWNTTDSKFETFTRSVSVLPIGLNDGGWYRELGVSDPVEGYYAVEAGGITIDTEEIIDGLKFTEDVTTGVPVEYAFDTPVDQFLNEDHYNQFLKNDGLSPGYRTVHLQRLANPLVGHDARTNPYLTIDSNSIDLFAFNGADVTKEPGNEPRLMRLGSYERRSDVDSERGQRIYERPEDGTINPNQRVDRHRILFKNDREGLQNALEDDDVEKEVEDAFFSQADSHILSRNFFESFGALNFAYRSAGPDIPKPFGWLTWNNRPFVSHLELANVPHTSSYWMTRMFDVAADSSRNVYRPPADEQPITEARNYTSHYPHLLNFYADSVEGETYGPSLHHVFDFLEVPSRFVGTESFVNPKVFSANAHGLSNGLATPFDTISNYRYPGKINVNTVLDFRVWNGLMDYYATGSFDNITFDKWEDSRNGNGKYDFANPLRPAHANNLVPPDANAIVDPAECGLFRRETGAEPLFDYNPMPTVSHSDTERAAYFRYDMRQRLGNLVTTRSSVFAVWITVGYFEANPDGSLRRDGSGQGIEAGASTGELRRGRGFFLVDRSIPVAFEPGQNHNVDRAVLVKSIIE